MSSDARSMRPPADEGFHEIHLSVKQLVFLFIATTLVSIVIFLCGVLVGRGARVEASFASQAAEAGVVPVETPPPAQGEPVVDSSAPAAATPDPGQPTQVESGDFNYFQMLTAEQQSGDVPQPAADEPETSAAPVAEAPAPAAQVPPPAKPEPARAEPVKTVPATPTPAAAAAVVPANAITLQVTALRERKEAEAVARRLQRKGYQAYVAEPGSGVAMYRVRVGPFSDRAEADRVRTRLTREEKFKPFIAR